MKKAKKYAMALRHLYVMIQVKHIKIVKKDFIVLINRYGILHGKKLEKIVQKNVQIQIKNLLLLRIIQYL